MNRFKAVLLLVLLVFIGGCATGDGGPKIYVNHAPAENFLLVLTNPETEITLYSKALRHYVHAEEDESDVWYEPLPIGEKVEVTKDTKGVSISLRIGNTQKVHYSLVHVYTIKLKSDDCAFTFEEELYEGNFSRKDFVVDLVLTDNVEHGKAHVEIRDEEGMPILFSQEVVYARKGGANPEDY